MPVDQLQKSGNRAKSWHPEQLRQPTISIETHHHPLESQCRFLV